MAAGRGNHQGADNRVLAGLAADLSRRSVADLCRDLLAQPTEG